MKVENMLVHPNEGETTEVVIREVSTVNELPVKSPIKIAIVGTINAPAIFLKQRWDAENNCVGQYPGNECEKKQIESSRCHVIVERESNKIILVINENNDYSRGTVEGKIEPHPLLEKFGINTGKQWAPNDLAKFFKMHRAFFANIDENMDLVSKLSAFKAKVNASIEKSKDQSGSFEDNYSAAVESNLPGTFKLRMPLFKGHKNETFEVEFDASVNGRDFKIELISPSAQQTFDEARDEIIDDVISCIQDIADCIPIIEK